MSGAARHPQISGFLPVGTWLSLVEHSLGVRGVGSSNLPVPTNTFQMLYVESLRLQRLVGTKSYGCRADEQYGSDVRLLQR